MARALAAAIAGSLLAVSGAGGAPAQTPKRGGTVVVAQPAGEPACLNPVTFERCVPGIARFQLKARDPLVNAENWWLER